MIICHLRGRSLCGYKVVILRSFSCRSVILYNPSLSKESIRFTGKKITMKIKEMFMRKKNITRIQNANVAAFNYNIMFTCSGRNTSILRLHIPEGRLIRLACGYRRDVSRKVIKTFLSLDGDRTLNCHKEFREVNNLCRRVNLTSESNMRDA